jgi:hypothetical protein
VFEKAGLSVREQEYQYAGQRVTNVLATAPRAAAASAYYLVGAHYDTVPDTPGADDNASAVAVMLELAQRLSHERLKAPVLFAAFTLEEPPAYLTDHQGSRIFVRSCQTSGDRVLGAIILEMVGLHGATPAISISATLARLSWRGKLHWYYRKLAVVALWTCRSDGLPQEHKSPYRVALSSIRWTNLARNALERPRLILGRRFASAHGHGHGLLPKSKLPPAERRHRYS